MFSVSPSRGSTTEPSPAPAAEDRLGVFISYSRRDCLDFAPQLAKALELLGHRAILDLQGISGAEAWQPRLREMILEADTVVFVMSPESARSEICAWEVEEAYKLGKRIIPLIALPLGEQKPPERLRQLHYIHFYSEPTVPGSGFGQGLAKLDAALKADLGWLRQHRDVLLRAEAWEAKGRDPDRLLRGSALLEAERWAASRPITAPDLTDLQRGYLAASRAGEDADAAAREREVAERERLAREAIAAAERAEAAAKKAEEAQKAREIAQVAAIEAARRAARWSQALLAVSALVFVLIAGLYIVYLQGNLEQDLKIKAQRAESGLLSSYASTLTDARGMGPAGLATLLALEALPDKQEGIERAYVPLAQAQLRRNFRLLREHAVLRGHVNVVKFGRLNLQGTLALTYSDDRTARLWRVSDGQEIARLDIGSNSVESAAFSPDGTTLTVGQGNGSVRIFDAATGKLRAHFKKHWGGVIHVSYDASGQRLATASVDNTARIWDVQTGNLLNTLSGHFHYVTRAVFNASGESVATASFDGTIRVWRLANGAEVLRLTGHEQPVIDVAFQSGGETLASASRDGTVRVWNLENGREVRRFGALRFVLQYVSGNVSEPILSVDGRFALTADSGEKAEIWDIDSQRRVSHLDWSAWGIGQPIFSPDGAYVLALLREASVGVWDARSGDFFEQLDGHRGRIASVATSKSGLDVLTTSFDGSARLWQLNGEFERKLRLEPEIEHDAANLSWDGTLAVTASHGRVKLWDTVNGSKVAELPVIHETTTSLAGDEVPKLRITHVVLSRSKDRLVLAKSDGTVELWDVASSRKLKELLKLDGNIIQVAWSDDGRKIGVLDFNGAPRVIETESGTEVQGFRHGAMTENAINAFAFDGSGEHIVTSGEDYTARVWRIQSGEELFRLRGHTDGVRSAMFSPDGSTIVTASRDGSARIWSISDGRELLVLDGGATPMWRAEFSHDGRLIVTSSDDGNVRLWDAANGELRDLISAGAATSPSAARLRSTDDQLVRIWTGGELRATTIFNDLEELISTAKNRVQRCLDPREREFYFLSAASPQWCQRRNLWPYDVGARIYSANLENMYGRPQKAMREADDIIAMLSQHNDIGSWQLGAAYLARGVAREQLNDRAGADADFKQALDLGHDISRVFLDKAFGLLNDGRNEKALAAFATAISWAARRGSREEWKELAHFERGKALNGLGRENEAVRDFEQVGSNLRVEVIGYHLLQGMTLAQSQPEVASAAFDRALEWSSAQGTDPDLRARVLIARGLTRLETGSSVDGFADLELAGETATPMASAYLLGRAKRLGSSDIEESLRWIEQALNWARREGGSKFDEAEALMERGRLRARQGNLALAWQDFEAVKSLGVPHSQFDTARADLLVRIALDELARGKLDTAFDSVETAIRAAPHDSAMKAVRGLINARRGSCHWAIRDLTSSLRLSKSDVGVLVRYQLSEQTLLLARAECHERQGHPRAAIADYRRVIRSLGSSRTEEATAKSRLKSLGADEGREPVDYEFDEMDEDVRYLDETEEDQTERASENFEVAPTSP